jgi:hypothetical protein
MQRMTAEQAMTCKRREKAVTRAANEVEIGSSQPREGLAKAIADEGYGIAT